MIHYAYYDCPLGHLKIGCDGDKVVLVNCTDRIDGECCPCELSDRVYMQFGEYFDGKRREFDFPIEMRGTEFQKRVWQALLEVPYGETRTYGEIAKLIGNPRACRAVGMACNRNPIWIAVPCHRIIGTGNKLTGYEGGLDMKEKLLTLEKCDLSKECRDLTKRRSFS